MIWSGRFCFFHNLQPQLPRLALQVLCKVPVVVLLDRFACLGGQFGKAQNLVLKNFQASLKCF
ncbi:MAG: hypothetical protein WCA99_04060 [Candidatus Sulfotelmatobacter sp.]